MKNYSIGNTINNTDQGENSIELLNGSDTYSAYDFNRPLDNLYSNQKEKYEFVQHLIKSVYGKQTGVLKNILEEFTPSTNNPIIFNYPINSSSYYLRVPTGALLDRVSSDDSSTTVKTGYTLDDFNSFGVMNAPNTSLFERQLASLINLDLTENGNSISIKYNDRTLLYTMDVSIEEPLKTTAVSFPMNATYASGVFSFSGTINAASIITINIAGTNLTYTTINGMTVDALTTALYNLIIANTIIMASYGVVKTTVNSLTITSKTVGTSINGKTCSVNKVTGSLPELSISSSNYFAGGTDLSPMYNTFDILKAFTTYFSGYNISTTNAEKFSLEPIFNISKLSVGQTYYLYHNKATTKNFINLSNANTSVTDCYGRFILSAVAPTNNNLLLGTLLASSSTNPIFTKNVSLVTLDSETIYPKRIVSGTVTSDILNAGDVNFKSHNFLAKSTVVAQSNNYYSKIATFDATKAFGTITCSIISTDTIAPEKKAGVFNLRIQSGLLNPTIDAECSIYKGTISLIRVEVDYVTNIGTIFVKHGNLSHTLELNLLNSKGITLITKSTNISETTNNSAGFIYEKDLSTIVTNQYRITNEAISILNNNVALKAISGNQTLLVNSDAFSVAALNNSLTINSTTTTLSGGNVIVDAGLAGNSKTILLRSKTTGGTTLLISDSVLGITATDTNINGNLTTSGITKVSNTTASTSAITGAFLVSGGAGIAGSLNVGGTLGITGDASFVNINISGLVSSSKNISTSAAFVGKLTGNAATATAATAAATITVGTCTTTQDIATKIIIDPNFVLTTGSIINVLFTYDATVSSTLNVNGTGSYAIKYYEANTTSSTWSSGNIVGFIFDGTYWCITSIKSSNGTVIEVVGGGSNTLGNCSSISGSSFIVPISGFKCTQGKEITVVMGVNSVAAGFLNVNGTGAFEIRYYEGQTTTSTWSSGQIVGFIFDGAYWCITYIKSVTGAVINLVGGGSSTYGTCAATETSTAKAVVLPGFSRTIGAKFSVLFSCPSLAGAYINVNGKDGPSGAGTQVYYNGSEITSTTWVAGNIVDFIYTGYFYVITGISTNISSSSSKASLSDLATLAKVATTAYNLPTGDVGGNIWIV